MKLKTIKSLSLGLALAAFLTTAAKGQIVYYTWVAGNEPNDLLRAGSGTLELNGTTVVSLSFTYGTEGTFTGFTGLSIPFPPVQILGDNDAVLYGYTGTLNGLSLVFTPTASPFPNEENVQDNSPNISGNWVPVPEPATMISGAMLLLPFGASTLRSLRKNRTA